MSAALQPVKTELVLLDLNNDVLQSLIIEILLCREVIPFLVDVCNVLLFGREVFSLELCHELVHDDPHSLSSLAPILERHSLTFLLTGKLVALDADLLCEYSIRQLHYVIVA